MINRVDLDIVAVGTKCGGAEAILDLDRIFKVFGLEARSIAAKGDVVTVDVDSKLGFSQVAGTADDKFQFAVNHLGHSRTFNAINGHLIILINIILCLVTIGSKLTSRNQIFKVDRDDGTVTAITDRDDTFGLAVDFSSFAVNIIVAGEVNDLSVDITIFIFQRDGVVAKFAVIIGRAVPADVTVDNRICIQTDGLGRFTENSDAGAAEFRRAIIENFFFGDRTAVVVVVKRFDLDGVLVITESLECIDLAEVERVVVVLKSRTGSRGGEFNHFIADFNTEICFSQVTGSGDKEVNFFTDPFGNRVANNTAAVGKSCGDFIVSNFTAITDNVFDFDIQAVKFDIDHGAVAGCHVGFGQIDGVSADSAVFSGQSHNVGLDTVVSIICLIPGNESVDHSRLIHIAGQGGFAEDRDLALSIAGDEFRSITVFSDNILQVVNVLVGKIEVVDS